MHADITPLLVGITILVSSLVSLRLGISVAIIEIILGVTAGAVGLEPEAWMIYLAGFGGIVLTYLAGAEIDARLLRVKLKESLLIGFFSFFTPFILSFAYAYYIAGWSLKASLITGTAMSETSIAVVYSVLLESNLLKTKVGKMLMATTFVTNTGTAIALSILFAKPTLYMAVFIVVSIFIIYGAYKFSNHLLESPIFGSKVIETEIKYVFCLLLVFVFFAAYGGGHAILPAFLLGLFMSRHFSKSERAGAIKGRIRTVAFAFITPIFFIVVGMKVSLGTITAAIGVFIAFLLVKQVAKFFGIIWFAKKYVPHGAGTYVTLLLSTGLTFGLIALVFGRDSGFIDESQYSILTGVLIASAIIPAFIAQKWFFPKHSEDLPDEEYGRVLHK